MFRFTRNHPEFRQMITDRLRLEVRLHLFLLLVVFSGSLLYLCPPHLLKIASLAYCLVVSAMTIRCIWAILNACNHELDQYAGLGGEKLKPLTHLGLVLRRHVLVLVLYGYVVIAVAYALAYHVTGSVPKATSPGDCVYFSIITLATVGYGDLTPVGFGRVLASSQVLTGMAYQLLAFASAASYFGRFIR